MVMNVHTRELNCSMSQAACLIDRLASKDEILWQSGEGVKGIV